MIYQKLYVFYYNLNQYFDNEKLREFLRNEKKIINYNLLKSFKNTKIIKMCNKLFEKVL